MKIRTKTVMTVAMMAGALLAASCAADVERVVNTDPEGNALSFTASIGRDARATEVKIGNLGDFAVMARGMHPDGVLYNAYMIGDATGGEIAQRDNASGPTANIWILNRSVYWPASTSRALFIAYTTLKNGESSADGVLGDATFEIPTGTDKPTIKGFKPSKASLTGTGNNGVWADGKDQKDLLVAFKAQDRGTSTTVNLNFRHALTQVSITARRKDQATNDQRIVKIKGAWVVNAAQSGDLSATITVDKFQNEFPVTNKTAWDGTGYETYGSYYNDGIPLTGDKEEELLRESLMLIPQSLTAWDGNKAGKTDATAETTTGAYLMLLCRVELVHDGTTHSGANISDIAIEGGKHYHQLFPVNTEKYDGAQYGFVCVPLSTDWAETVDGSDDLKGMGKHYTYKLDICGLTSGAGVYPPIPADGEPAAQLVAKLIPSGAIENALVWDDTENKYMRKDVTLNVVTKRASGKKVGDPVLDEPIKFSVTVSDWLDQTEWNPGEGESDPGKF